MSRDAAAAVSSKPASGPPKPVELQALASRVGAIEIMGPSQGVRVRRAVYDHRRLEPSTGAGDLFCCLVGEHDDGHEFAVRAAEHGAVALLVEHPVNITAEVPQIPQIVVGEGRGRPAMAEAACLLAGDPASSLVTVGVTGTNGKTTTTYLVSAILERHGWPTAVVGTLGGSRTTPEAPELQAALRRAVASGRVAVALEVTSHALAQHRADGYRHDVAVFTNLSQDHLDYHHTMEAYFEAKALLFREEHARSGVINADDGYGRRLLERRDTALSVLDRRRGLSRARRVREPFRLAGRACAPEARR